MNIILLSYFEKASLGEMIKMLLLIKGARFFCFQEELFV
jgi:hypothetical protein